MVNQTGYAALYRFIREQLSSTHEGDLLFRHVTGMRVWELAQRGNDPAGQVQWEAAKVLCRRRQEGEPLQYLLGEWEFYGLPFFVGEGVLIPRPDTECLVDVALEYCGDRQQLHVLDLCSGSGAVAVALAVHLPATQITAVEYSDAAYDYLLRNIQRNLVKVEAIQADAYRYIPAKPLELITANPPYIPSKDLPELQKEVSREPEMALDGGADGLDFYRMIAERYIPFLSVGGGLCVEVGIGQAGDVAALFAQNGLAKICIHPDLCGVDRIVAGVRSTE